MPKPTTTYLALHDVTMATLTFCMALHEITKKTDNLLACPLCGGSGQRATARSANGRELERHERSGTPCECQTKKADNLFTKEER